MAGVLSTVGQRGRQLVRRALYKVFGFRVECYRDYLWRKLIDIFRRRGWLLTPVDATLRLLEIKGLLPKPMIGLEVFGRHGLWKTLDYAARCEYLEFYEIDPGFASFARKVLPKATTTVRVMDSIDAVREGTLLRSDYSLVVIDNWTGAVNGHYEHFDLFPALFSRLGRRAVLVMNVWLEPSKMAAWHGGASASERQLGAEYARKRRQFYGVETEDKAMILPQDKAMDAYRKKARDSGYSVTDMFFVPHAGETLFLVMCVERA